MHESFTFSFFVHTCVFSSQYSGAANKLALELPKQPDVEHTLPSAPRVLFAQMRALESHGALVGQVSSCGSQAEPTSPMVMHVPLPVNDPTQRSPSGHALGSAQAWP